MSQPPFGYYFVREDVNHFWRMVGIGANVMFAPWLVNQQLQPNRLFEFPPSCIRGPYKQMDDIVENTMNDPIWRVRSVVSGGWLDTEPLNDEVAIFLIESFINGNCRRSSLLAKIKSVVDVVRLPAKNEDATGPQSVAYTEQQAIVLLGSIVDGIKPIGPFASNDQGQRWVEQNASDEECIITKLHTPEPLPK